MAGHAGDAGCRLSANLVISRGRARLRVKMITSSDSCLPTVIPTLNLMLDMAETQSTTDDPEKWQPAAVGIKLGSTRTVLSLPNGATNEVIQTLTCIAEYEDALTGQPTTVFGDEAAVEYPDRVQYMLRSGLPEDEARAELAATFFEEFTRANGVPEESVAVYAIPTIDNERGLENLESVIDGSSIGDVLVRSYPESLCSSIPAKGNGLEAINDIFIAVNMGSTNLEACAYRRGEQLTPYVTGAVTGNEVDRKIVGYVEEETQGRVKIDLTTAREYKEEHADFDDYQPFTDVVQQPGGGSHEFTIERAVMDACEEYLDETVEEIADRFLPELASDYMKLYQIALSKPIVLTGGMACIPGIVEAFETRLSEVLQRDVRAVAPPDPATAAAEGAQRIAQRLVEQGTY